MTQRGGFPVSRRDFASSALALSVAGSCATSAIARSSPEIASAIEAIRAYGQAHLDYNHLPGMTLGVVTPDGSRTTLNFGFANSDARAPIISDTLFQIGSISKVMVATVLHQLAAEGKLRLSDRVSDLLPAIPLPSRNPIQVQHLLDHVAGLPDDAPAFVEGGLWTAYEPGQHWHYSNTGYEILGKLAEHIGGKPLAELLVKRIFLPLKMSRTRGAIIGAERERYAQGYEAADMVSAYARGAPLAPAPWVDVTFGAGCVGSTAEDMLAFLLELAHAVQGRSALGLSPLAARQFATHAVPSDTPGMAYGNGLMHVGANGRAYLHHTGGMLSFSSSFHVDVASGVGAFASTTLTAFAEYRPRLLTRFAVDALTDALLRRPLPVRPPLQPDFPSAASYVGHYSGPRGAFDVKPGAPLTLVADGESAALQPIEDGMFRTLHPAFHEFTLMFEGSARERTTRAAWGPNFYRRSDATVSLPTADPALARLAGRYINDNPWYGAMIVVERGGSLWIGTETPMAKIGANLWRVGKESWSPERASFADFLDERPQTFIFSGEKFIRHDI